MAPNLLPDHRNRIAALVQLHNLGDREIARIERCSKSSVAYIRHNIDLFGGPSPPKPRMKAGPKWLIAGSIVVGLRGFIEAKPWSYLEEMQYYLFDMFEILPSLACISRSLRRLRINRKNLKRVAAERSEEERAAYMLELCELSHEQLIYIDESAANEHTPWRKRGWSAFGLVPSIKMPVKRSERYSILPAYTSSGIIANHVYQGSIDSARLAWWLEEEVFIYCTPFPGPRSVIIMDNCSTHHWDYTRETCERVGVKLLYLPPYSPDLNPIEEFFSVMKAWMKKHGHWLEGPARVPLEAFFRQAVESCSCERMAKKHFRHAGVSVP